MAQSKTPRAPSQPRVVQCVACAAHFETRHSQGRYCSQECSRQGERKSWREYGERNRDRRRAYQQDHYAGSAERIIAQTEAYRRTPAGRQARITAQQNQKLHAPDKLAARYAVKVALQQGLMARQPCARCETEPTEAHHPDYAQPLDVVWLCRPCHLAEHGRVSRTKPLVAVAAE